MGNVFDKIIKKGRKSAVKPLKLNYSFDAGCASKIQKVKSEEKDESLKEELQALKKAIEEMKEPEPDLSPLTGKIDEAIMLLSEQKKETQEIIHSENVKVYRNVQAVVVEESSKVKDTIKKSTVKAAKKANLAFVFALLAFVFAVLDLIFNILVKLNVF